MAAERKPNLPDEPEDLLEELRAVLPDTPRAKAVYERVRRHLDPKMLLTLREAANFLGIREEGTLRTLLRVENVPVEKVGTETRVARGALERIRESERVLRIQASDRAWDEINKAFSDDGLSEEEMEILWQTRPGTVPWERPTA